MPKYGVVLDLGCGAGEPIASYFLKHGHSVVGLDASANMIRLARENIPTGDWRLGDMRTFDFPDRFYGVIGWNSFFHLTREEQRNALPITAKHLRPEGALLLTVGPHDGGAAGCVGDGPVYHASLSQYEYTDILSSLSINIQKFVPKTKIATA
jgi:SAM-dependent methyltransferase